MLSLFCSTRFGVLFCGFRSNILHPLCGALPVPFLLLRVNVVPYLFLLCQSGLDVVPYLRLLCQCGLHVVPYHVPCLPVQVTRGALPVPCLPVRVTRGALPVPCLPVQVTRGVLATHRYSYAPPRCLILQCHRISIPNWASLCNDLGDSMFDGVGLAGFKSKDNVSLLAWASLSLYVFYCFHVLFLPFMSWRCGVGVFWLIECMHPISDSLAMPTFINDNNNVFGVKNIYSVSLHLKFGAQNENNNNKSWWNPFLYN